LDEITTKTLSRVITGDKTWVYCYDPETRKQSSQWKNLTYQPEESKASQVEHQELIVDLF
jgi:hypothetical protein